MLCQPASSAIPFSILIQAAYALTSLDAYPEGPTPRCRRRVPESDNLSPAGEIGE